MNDELERFLPQLRGRIAYEHKHRYALCSAFVRDRRVLDVSCGEGYGSAFLGEFARDVVGVDLDQATINRARKTYASSRNVRFEQGDCRKLPFRDGCFDVVVSFELIEHIPDGDLLIAEARRVLRPGGLLVISTPDRTIYNRYLKEPNRHHVHEYAADEFHAALSAGFPQVRMLGQRFHLGSFVTLPPDLGSGASSYRGYLGGEADVGIRVAPGLAPAREAEYLIAFCSDGPLPDLAEALSVYVDPDDDLFLDYEKVVAWASNVHDEDEKLRRRVNGLVEERQALEERLATEVGRAELYEQMAKRGQDLTQTLTDEARDAARRYDESVAERSARVGQMAEALRDAEVGQREARLRLDEATAENEALKRRFDLLSGDFDQLRDRHDRVQAENLSLATRIRERDGEILSSSLRLEAAESALQDSRREQIASEHARQVLQLEIAAHQATIAADRETRAAASEAARVEIDELRASVAEAADRLAHTEDVNAHLEAERVKSEARVEALVSKSERLEKRIIATNEASAAEAKRATDALRSALGRVAALSAHADMAALVADCQDRIRRSTIALRMSGKVRGFVAGAAKVSPPRLGRRRRVSRLADQLRARGLFADDWYADVHADQIGAEKPFDHFLREGLWQGLDPHPLFMGAWYRERVGTDLPHGLTAIEHYLARRDYDALAVHPLFDHAYYCERYPDVAAARIDPLSHYLDNGWREGRHPHPLFDPDYYSEARSEGARAHSIALIDYLVDPDAIHASPHPLFDSLWYCETYFDLLGDANPLVHYLSTGWRIGCKPHPFFDNDWYLAKTPDLASSDTAPLAHYARIGWKEPRSPHPMFDAAWYVAEYPDVVAADMPPLVHFITSGAREGRRPNGSPAVQAYYEVFAGAAHEVADFFLGRLRAPDIRRSTDRSINVVQGAFGPDSTALDARHPHAPAETDQYWLPQGLRDYVLDRFGEAAVTPIGDLMALVDRFGFEGTVFEASPQFGELADRVRLEASRHAVEDPDVSIVVPVHNGLVYTLTCLASLFLWPCDLSFEVIVADDASTDGTNDCMRTMAGAIVHVRQEANLGFLRNCNAAAEKARGRYVVFLNNDTILLPGWLDALVRPLMNDASIGMTGSKLLNGDGTLQEAGGIFWNDGSAWNFGRNQDPRMPEFNYTKDVDYCSGASIALSVDVWRRTGGFDPIFVPAYCEDSDLAFRLREEGLRVVYTPHSEVIHHEGRSHGRDTSSGIKAYQVANNEKLLARWADVLKRDHFGNAENVVLARDRSRGKPHILMVDHYIPQWDRDAGSRTVYLYVKLFVDEGFQVTFWPDNLFEDRKYCRVLQSMGVEVIYSSAYVDRFGDWYAERAPYFDYVYLSRPHIAMKYIDAIRRYGDQEILYYGHDIHWQRNEREYELSGDPQLLVRVREARELEVDLWRACDTILYPSQDEIDVVRDVVGDDKAAAAIPMAYYGPEETALGQANVSKLSSSDAHALMFVGGFSHGPNVDGVRWFVEEVLPLLLADDPLWHLVVAGSNATPEIRAYDSPNVKIAGQISDEELGALYASSGAAIVPLRYGAGVKGKVIEAFVKGVPVFTTRTGIQGIPDGENLAFVAESAEDFAAALISSAKDDAVRVRKAENALAFIRERYSAEGAMACLAPFISEFDRKLETNP